MVRLLYSSNGYFDRFYNIIYEKQCSYREAYEILETEFEQLFGERKYSSYSSFKTRKSAYLSKQKVNKVNQIG